MVSSAGGAWAGQLQPPGLARVRQLDLRERAEDGAGGYWALKGGIVGCGQRMRRMRSAERLAEPSAVTRAFWCRHLAIGPGSLRIPGENLDCFVCLHYFVYLFIETVNS